VALAGAWTLPQGSGQAVVTATVSSAGSGYNGTGLTPIARYNKLELQGLLEYGMTDSFTAIVSPGLRHVDINSPVDARRTGLGYTEFGGRYRLLQAESWVVSGQATFRVPGTNDISNPAAIGYTGVESDIRGLVGYGFAFRGMPAFVDLELQSAFAPALHPTSSVSTRPSGCKWLARDLSGLDLLVVQIDGINITDGLVLIAAIGIDTDCVKHPLALAEGATENAAVVQALIDDLKNAGLIRRYRGYSSSTARRRCPRRSGAASGATRRSSVVRFTRPATLWSGCRRRCTLRSAARCARPGNCTTQRRPRN
jgi:hypothetical protein